MFSKKPKQSESIGNGLLNDQQKYREGQNEGVEMKPISARYNYVNLDNQGSLCHKADDYVVKQEKPSKQQNYQMKQMGKKIEPEAINQNQHAGQANLPRKDDYPSFDYEPVPERPHKGGQPSITSSQLPVYQSQFRSTVPTQSPTYPYQNVRPQIPYYQSNIQSPWAQPQYTSGYYHNPSYSSVMIPGISHGQLRPAINNQPQNNHLQMQSQFSSRMVPPVSNEHTAPQNISMNGMTFQSQMKVNQSQINRQPEEKTYMPQMYVTCQYCYQPQNIPGDSTVFICYHCQRKIQCYPTHSIFKCGGCNKKVAYQLGTSNLIRCGKCKTVNEVAVTHQQALNKSMLNISKIQPKDTSVEEEQKEEVPKKKKQKLVERSKDEEPLLNVTEIQYPNLGNVNAEQSEGQLEEIVDRIKSQDEQPLRKKLPRQ